LLSVIRSGVGLIRSGVRDWCSRLGYVIMLLSCFTSVFIKYISAIVISAIWRPNRWNPVVVLSIKFNVLHVAR